MVNNMIGIHTEDLKIFKSICLGRVWEHDFILSFAMQIFSHLFKNCMITVFDNRYTALTEVLRSSFHRNTTNLRRES